MKIKSEQAIPLLVSVGQVVVFPYYIVWLKQAALSFTLFGWLFAIFSFSAAFGYRLYQTKGNKYRSHHPFIYAGMGAVYILAGTISQPADSLPYIALLLQTTLGFLQGYHHAWHIEQKTFRLHAIHHYLIVGIAMIGISFVKIISPGVVIAGFGVILFGCAVWSIWKSKRGDVIPSYRGEVKERGM
ncbi:MULTISPECIES: hypothetical protein [Bacillus]|uniref:Uncharacterized protein n=1 Tax=Bacillus infantis NRRL B-14911 TaxID=1367477 RepID=U5LEU9_9BACI|nr:MULTISPECIES: hypothetical protein [Bacillus]AGX06379.1 hypothetical protein N288_22700 [Bacillus infantis NRRL B-14911]EAR68692.1 hypothetical protein B14911_03879 [Bacillus sp. NRRL B-14911]